MDGNVFMVFLKLARHQNGGTLNMDDFIDGAAYMAMAGEAAGNQPKEAPVAIPKSGVGVAYSSEADAKAIADYRRKIEEANASHRK